MLWQIKVVHHCNTLHLYDRVQQTDLCTAVLVCYAPRCQYQHPRSASLQFVKACSSLSNRHALAPFPCLTT